MNRKDRLNMRNKAQATVEYMVLFGVIVAALVAMQVYLKRGIQGRLRGYTEQLSQGSAYSPGATNSLSTITKDEKDEMSSYTQKIVGPKNKLRISESSVQINQTTNRLETTLSFSDEPRRW